MAKHATEAAPTSRPRKVDGDISAFIAYVAALEGYCNQIEAVARTLARQNYSMAVALAWYADSANDLAADQGERARAAIRE